MDEDCCELPDEDLIRAGDQKIAGVIQEVMNERFPNHAPYMAINWQLTALIVDQDGERAMWPMAPLEARVWETMGLLNFNLEVERAQMIIRELRD